MAGSTSFDLSKKAAGQLGAWIQNHTSAQDRLALVRYQNRENHAAITAGHNSNLSYYEGYDPFDIAFNPAGTWKGPWRNIVEVDASLRPTKKFFITNDHYQTIKGPYTY
eukprot:TRINITY_DN77573_c0_g1_i1.p1 TRINITY_DN77573_c0_g1~~TRINITY_DN77573_c0_g1_i1.p1  ORF type:complete len:109 (-),score=22.85 TRINITY_DN77573_c0_g1_i1:37-363(-)